MKISITEIANHPEGLEIKAIVFARYLPPPDYKENETDEQYAERVKPIAEDMDGFNNLHIGWAELKQKPDTITIPRVNDYE